MSFVYRTTGLLLEVDIHPHSISEKTKRKEYKFQGVSKKKKKVCESPESWQERQEIG